MYAILYAQRFLFSTDKVGYNTVITLEDLGEVSGGLVTLPQKMNAEKNKIVLKYIQF